jgi:hypothetical protein
MTSSDRSTMRIWVLLTMSSAIAVTFALLSVLVTAVTS